MIKDLIEMSVNLRVFDSKVITYLRDIDNSTPEDVSYLIKRVTERLKILGIGLSVIEMSILRNISIDALRRMKSEWGKKYIEVMKKKITDPHEQRIAIRDVLFCDRINPGDILDEITSRTVFELYGIISFTGNPERQKITENQLEYILRYQFGAHLPAIRDHYSEISSTE